MKKLRIGRLIIFSAVLICLWFTASKVHDFMEGMDARDIAASAAKRYIGGRLGAHLEADTVKVNLFNNIVLGDVSVSGIKGLPEDIKIRIKSVSISYSPLSLITGRWDAEFSGAEALYGDIKIPLELSCYERAVSVTFIVNSLKLESLPFLSSDNIKIEGIADVSGCVTITDSMQTSLDITVKGKTLKLECSKAFKVRGNIALTITGPPDAPEIHGNTDIYYLYMATGLPAISVIKSQAGDITKKLPAASVLDVEINGRDTMIDNRDIRGRVNVDMAFKKNAREKPYLSGKIDIADVEYRAYKNKFSIKGGAVEFSEKGRAPDIKIDAETKVKRYKLFARIRGTLDDSNLTLSSKPELSRNDIVSLLMFGRRLDGLAMAMQEEVKKINYGNILINNLLFGVAEANLEKWTGLDNVDLVLDTHDSAEKNSGLFSVGLGKCFADDRVFVGYKADGIGLKEGIAGQAVEGELGLTDNVSIKGKKEWAGPAEIPQKDKTTINFTWKF